MKNANQIRQLLNSILEIPWQPTSIRTEQGFMVGILADDKDFVFESIQEALALLPCERCGGTNGIHKQVDDPQAGNSNMLTKMQCPLDK